MRLGVEVCGLHVISLRQSRQRLNASCLRIVAACILGRSSNAMLSNMVDDEINVTKGATMLALVPVVVGTYMEYLTPLALSLMCFQFVITSVEMLHLLW
jgi:hypothetical protein